MTTKTSRSPRRSLIINLSLVALAFGLLGLVIYQNRAQVRQVFAKPVDPRYFVAGLLIYLVALMITFFRWSLLVRAQGIALRLRDAIRLGFIGNVFNLVIPGAVGGDVIKAAFLCRMRPDQKPQAVASMVIDRILGLMGLFLLAGIAGGVMWGSATPQVRILIGLVWGALLAGFTALGVVFSPQLYQPLNRLVAGRGKLEAIVKRLESIGGAYRQSLGTVFLCLGMASLTHGLFVLAFYTVSVALFPTLPTLAQHYLMVPLVLFTTAVPLPFGALGLTEQISGQLFQMVHHAEGAVAMMAFRVLMYGNGIISACVYLANLRQVRSLEAEAEKLVEGDDDGIPSVTEPLPS
ncbi:lysylphosphatidylglycerol synthase transmembrane domain-containing protein [Tundrisphaera sp. TA3]|uniref:lysylphosphatidylglycerol synthase transmembrane domain-containing protein n=1 Tax=Tundrisphaera sp. TA3 TaxID=3435775 RepID=UPI003EB6BD86